MRAVFVSTSLALILLLAVAPLGAAAQESAPAPALPGQPPAASPGPDAPNGGAMPGERTPPMVVPPPDEGSPETPPEAFGSPSATEIAPAPDEKSAAADATPEARLDRLFSELSREPDAEKAKAIASRIEAEWRRSGSATVDLLMLWAAQAMGHKQNAAAYDMLESALVLAPNYAEAWNRRATLNFSTDQWGKSLADIEQTLAREPRHYGALVGLGLILERMDRKERALEAYERALAVYPTLKSAQDAIGRLSDELLGPTL